MSPRATSSQARSTQARSTPSTVRQLRRQRQRQRRRIIALLLCALLAGVCLTLMLGQSWIDPATVIAVLSGEQVPGASFTLMELRLPRALIAVLAGACFGLGGAAFQTMLRNPLASPDVIGISAGASAAAVFAIVMLSLRGAPVALVAIVGGLGVAVLIYALSWRRGVADTRLILTGIGLAAMLQSAIAYLLTQAPAWPLQEAMRWMTGSLNSVHLDQSLPLVLALIVLGLPLLHFARDLEAMRLGDDMARGLGVRLSLTRLGIVVAAVGLVAFATAVTGPIAFVAFLSGPVAAWLIRHNGSVLIPAALVGALFVLLGDFIGQHLLPARYPVGVVTGVIGAPYLITLVMRDNARGST
ncbi:MULTISPECIES: iron chelate uptake ABC transporter family permease subunit [unclassified Halomonas]|uniref:FecCD family ABC transporter permease n=1 Tax=unclassified Halomonas TaxID=2609666 RepID=UPI0005F9C3AF|nr:MULTISPECIES: iron ABC transporter permease [unclassified Halomonas]